MSAECHMTGCTAGSKLNGLDKEGFSPLHLAVAHSHYGSMQVLLQLGASASRKNRLGCGRVTQCNIGVNIGVGLTAGV